MTSVSFPKIRIQIITSLCMGKFFLYDLVAENLNAKLEKSNSSLPGKVQNLWAWAVSMKKLGLKPFLGSERTTATQPNLAMQLFLSSRSYNFFSKFCTTVCKEDERLGEEGMRTARSDLGSD